MSEESHNHLSLSTTRRGFVSMLAATTVSQSHGVAAMAGILSRATAAPANSIWSDTRFSVIHTWLIGLNAIRADGEAYNRAVKNFQAHPHLAYMIAEKTVHQSLHDEQLAKMLVGFGKRLREEPPSLKLIQELVRNSDFKKDPLYKLFLHGKSEDSAIYELYRLATGDEMHMHDAISRALAEHDVSIRPYVELARSYPEVAEHMAPLEENIQTYESSWRRFECDLDKRCKNTKPPTMADIHNKAAYAPVAQNGQPLSNDEQKSCGLGLFAPGDRVSGCEHYETVFSRDESLRAHYTKK